jgi:hypothetical protein
LNARRAGQPDRVRALRRPHRSLIAALAAASLVYLVAGHAHHPGQSMEEAAVRAGICIVLVTFVAAVAALVGRAAVGVCRTGRDRSGATGPAMPSNRARARASPVWLQRFLN